MQCLWLTLADPEPRTNGQFIYSGGLIDALDTCGVRITVLGLSRGYASRTESQMQTTWLLATDRPRSRLSGLTSFWPQVSMRSRTAEMRRNLAACLGRTWDVVVFDSISVGWALDAVQRYRRQNPRTALVYLSHNHERTVAEHIASNDPHPMKRLFKRIDAAKVARLERRLVREADLVTANTPEDATTFTRGQPRQPAIILRPGYDGCRVHQRLIDAALPRRAIIVGSFDWLPKRVSLERFLSIAAPAFAGAGVELQVVGQAEPGFLVRLATQHPAVTFTGAVADILPYLAQARIALVPDLLGGFKLKTLDYVFNRVPIFAMRGTVPGTPLVDGVSIRECDTHHALTQDVIALIDNFTVLNSMQAAAYSACDHAFDWRDIGAGLFQILTDICSRVSEKHSPEKRLHPIAAGD